MVYGIFGEAMRSNKLSTILFAAIAIASYVLLLKLNSPLEKSDLGFSLVCLFFALACTGADYGANEEMGNYNIESFSASSIADTLRDAGYASDRVSIVWDRKWFNKADKAVEIYQTVRDSHKLKWMLSSFCTIVLWSVILDITEITLKRFVIVFIMFGLFHWLPVSELFVSQKANTRDVVFDFEEKLPECYERLSIMEQVQERENAYDAVCEEYLNLVCSKIDNSKNSKTSETIALMFSSLTGVNVVTMWWFALSNNAAASIEICSCVFVVINIILTIT